MVHHQCNCSSCRPTKKPDRSPPWSSEWPSMDNCQSCLPPSTHPSPEPCPPPCPSQNPQPCMPPCPPPCPPPKPPCPPPCPPPKPPCPPPCPPPKPPCPPKDHGCREMTQILLPKVICSGREWQRRLCTTLEVNGLPDCAKPPYQLVSVQQSGAQPWWEPAKCTSNNGQAMYHVYIPVTACIVDCSGCEFFGTAVVEMDACLHLKCRPSECWRYNLIVVPCVRLACGTVYSDTSCFDVELEVVLELYLIQWIPYPDKPCNPGRRELPLYPQPQRPRPYTS